MAYWMSNIYEDMICDGKGWQGADCVKYAIEIAPPTLNTFYAIAERVKGKVIENFNYYQGKKCVAVKGASINGIIMAASSICSELVGYEEYVYVGSSTVCWPKFHFPEKPDGN